MAGCACTADARSAAAQATSTPSVRARGTSARHATCARYAVGAK